jgi:hypothetical protein
MAKRPRRLEAVNKERTHATVPAPYESEEFGELMADDMEAAVMAATREAATIAGMTVADFLAMEVN